MKTLLRPGPREHDPYFADYINRIADDEDIITVMDQQTAEVVARLEGIPKARGDYHYAPNKWSIKEVVGHLADAERIMSYRALRIARGDVTPLPGFDENAFVPESGAGARSLADLTAEWSDVRRATIALFRGLPSEAWARLGTASGKPISVRALAYIIPGHVRHHLEVLATRYGQ